MAYTERDWEALGRNIRDIVDQAVNQQDYQKLNQTIRQTVERAVDISGEAVRKAVDGVARTGSPSRQTVERTITSVPGTGSPGRQTVAETRNLAVLYGKTGNLTAKGLAKAVGGGVITAFSALASLASLVLVFAGVGAAPSVLTLAGLGGGIVLMTSGIKNLNRVSRFKAYRRTLGQKTHCTLDKLARSVGKSVKFVRRELTAMIDQGMFLEGHLDKEQTMLITSNDTYRLFENSRLQLEQRQREQELEAARLTAPVSDKRLQEVLDKGNAFIAEIRRCNDAIPGVEISAKIDHMESIVRRIFNRARTNPEIVPDLKKMMDYYLPMTVKLLNAYADMDAQPAQGENILNAKREIEGTLDTLNLAFEKLLDNLFADTALDVSSDISVLQTMLAQEGLTEDGLTQIRNQQ